MKINDKKLTEPDENGIDGYGVDHSDFSLRDELEYQFKMLGEEDNQISHSSKNMRYDNYLNEKQRINNLKNGNYMKLNIMDNPEANYDWPIYTIDAVGDYYVNKHNDSIEKYAAMYNIDPDLVKAVMYSEAATGHYFGGNYLRDLLGKSKSQMPMNIQGRLWGNYRGKSYDTYNPEQNIELGAQVLKGIQTSLDNPTADRIGTLWNNTGANKVNDMGARIGTAYKTKPWLK